MGTVWSGAGNLALATDQQPPLTKNCYKEIFNLLTAWISPNKGHGVIVTVRVKIENLIPATGEKTMSIHVFMQYAS